MNTQQELKGMMVTNELPVDFSMLSALVKEFFSQNGRPPELEARLWELTVDAISNPEAEAGLANAFRLQFYKDLVRLFENFELVIGGKPLPEDQEHDFEDITGQ